MTELRREWSRYSWVIAAIPLAGAALSASSLALCTWAAEALLHLDDVMGEPAVDACENDENPVAGPLESLCAACLETEKAGEPLPNRRRPERRTG